MNLISFEYCHVTPATDWKQEVHFTNEYVPRLLKTFSEKLIQKCIMIDDLHSKIPIDKTFVKQIINQLVVKPDCIYLESSFVSAAGELIDKISPKIIKTTGDNERKWLRQIKGRYASNSEFLLNWKKKTDVLTFSCPTLVASSYLTRLGHLNSSTIKILYGDKLKKADKLFNLLSSIYLQVEANAHLIIEKTFPQANKQIMWNFY